MQVSCGAVPTGSAQQGASGAGVRINKCLKHEYSRRHVDKMIDEKRIQINGQVCHLTAEPKCNSCSRYNTACEAAGAQHVHIALVQKAKGFLCHLATAPRLVQIAQHGDRLVAGDVVLCDGKHVNWEKMNDLSQAQSEFVYIKYWKPIGKVVTTDRRDDRNVLDAVRNFLLLGCGMRLMQRACQQAHAHLAAWSPCKSVSYWLCPSHMAASFVDCAQIKHPKRVYPIGRLDCDSSGLLLLTNDGRLVNALLRAEHKHVKRYNVTVDRTLSHSALQQLRDGVVIRTEAQRDRQHKVHIARTHPCDVKQV